MNGIGLIFHKNQTKSPISKQIKNFSNKIEERGQNTTILKNYENLDLFLSSWIIILLNLNLNNFSY